MIGFSGYVTTSENFHSLDGLKFTVKGNRKQISIKNQTFQCKSVVVESAASEVKGFFCGQLTNSKKIIQRLGVTPLTDLELASKIYEIYGVDGFKILEGLFVGVLLFPDKAILFSGKTPGPSLYYHYNKDLFFSTELKAFPAHLKKMTPYDELVLHEKSSSTCLCDVKRVRAGHSVELDFISEKLKETEYYSPQRAIQLVEEREVTKQLRDIMQNAVFSLPGRTANCLASGGLDSSIVAYLAKERYESVNLFSLGTASRNEFDKAEVFTKSIGLELTRLFIEESDFISALAELIEITEHYFSTFLEYLIPVHLAHKRIGNSADILLSGYGSDVLFAGFAKPTHSLSQVTALIREEYESTLWSNECSQVLGGSLGMEIGYPFFDSRVVDFAATIDPHLKHKNGIEKYVLRAAFSEDIAPSVVWQTKVGIHEGTGCEAYFSRLLSPQRLIKDRFCYEILKQIIVDNCEPQNINVTNLLQEKLNACYCC